MRPTVLYLFLIGIAGFCGSKAVLAQEDLVERARINPPRMLRPGDNRNNLAAIEWKIELRQNVLAQFQSRTEAARQSLEVYSEKIEKLNAKLPFEFRFLDRNARSQLIGKAMEELLNARLDLASRESSIVMLEKLLVEGSDTKKAQLERRKADISVQAASSKVKVAESEYQRVQKLADKASVSNREVLMAKYTLDIAKLELEKTILDAEIEGVEENTEFAQRLTEARIEIEPVKARITAAEEFLKSFVESSKTSAEIEETRLGFDRAKDGLRDWFGEMSQIEREIEELEMLKSRIKSDLKEMESEQNDNAKGE